MSESLRALPGTSVELVSLSTRRVESMSAVDLARKVKAGRLTRNAAIQRYRELNKCTFMDALMEIDIAIGDINEGNV